MSLNESKFVISSLFANNSEGKLFSDNSLQLLAGSREPSIGVFHCYHCEYSCRTKQGISRHLYSHLPSYICTICYSKFRTERTLFIHKKNEHSECFSSGPHSKSNELVKKIHSSESNKELLHCYLCEYSTRNKAGLSKHVRGHLPPRICSICGAKFRSEGKLLAHMRLEHRSSINDSNKELLHCYLCEYSTWNKAGLSKHVQGHLPPRICSMCGAKFRSERKLLAHERLKHPESKKSKKSKESWNEEPSEFSCHYCEWSTVLRSDLVAHMKIHRLPSVPRNCILCSFESNTRIAFVHHMMETHNLEKPFLCDECDYSSKFENCLKLHKAKHTGQKPYACNMCDYRTHNEMCLKIHMSRHSSEKPYTCDMCDFSTRYALNLVKHRRRHTGEKHRSEKLYDCDVCSFSSTWSHGLQQHRRIHTGEKPYACDLCDYRSARKPDLNAHKRVHTGEKPYACDMCDYRSSKSNVLKHHRRRHFGEKPYACNLCNYRATRNQSLTEHMRYHTGERPFACDKCDHRSIRSTDLKQHMRKHDMQKTKLQKKFRQRCEICDIALDSKTTFLAHMETHERTHPGDVTNISAGRPVQQRVMSVKGTITLFFNCPECSFRDRSKPLVEEHVSECHFNVSETKSKIWASTQWDSD